MLNSAKYKLNEHMRQTDRQTDRARTRVHRGKSNPVETNHYNPRDTPSIATQGKVDLHQWERVEMACRCVILAASC